MPRYSELVFRGQLSDFRYSRIGPVPVSSRQITDIVQDKGAGARAHARCIMKCVMCIVHCAARAAHSLASELLRQVEVLVLNEVVEEGGAEDQLAYWALSLLSLPPCPRADEPRMYSCNSKDAQVRASVVW